MYKDSVPNHLADSGFNLIEVLIAMVILSGGMLGTASLIVGIVDGNRASRSATIATTLAQSTMESIVQSGFSALSTTDSTTTQDYDTISGYEDYKVLTITEANTPGTRMATVTVKAHWRTGTNPVELTTILSR